MPYATSRALLLISSNQSVSTPPSSYHYACTRCFDQRPNAYYRPRMCAPNHAVALLPVHPARSPLRFTRVSRQFVKLPFHAQDSAVTAPSPIWPTSTDRPCHVRTTFIITTDQASAPQVRRTSPLHYFEVLYLFHYFPHLFPPSSGFSLGQMIRRLERI